MALYRNIAGLRDTQVGATLLQPGTYTMPKLLDPAYREEREQLFADYEVQMNTRYDWLMSHSYEEVTGAGYYALPDNGSIFKWSDASKTTSQAYLSLDWIQKIENERGYPGALLLHMQEPALAKDTAGYEGGSSGTWYEQNGADPTTQQVTDPIIAVQVLPPVVTDPTGVVYFDPATAPADTFPIPTDPTTTATPPTTTTPTTSTPLPADWQTVLKNNWLPVAVIGGLLVVSIGGDKLIRRRSRLVFIGGIGGLFFLMAKK